MANISVTYTFSNGTTADAGEVNTNFQDILDGTSDSTKDFSINALTVAGTATLNGAVNLGNATSDDITFNGYIASNMIPKTTAASDLGSSTLNWQSLYLDDGATNGGAIYFDAGTTEYIKANAAGTDLDIGGFQKLDIEAGYYQETTSAKSADYTVTDTDGIKVILMTTGSSTAKTVTLPTAADNTGRTIKVVKVDSGTKKCTVDGEGSELCGGNTSGIDLVLQFDFVEVVCDGTEWHVIGLRDTTPWTDFTPSWTNDTNVSFSVSASKWRRVGASIEIVLDATTGGNGTNSGNLGVKLPLSLNHTESTSDTKGMGIGRLATSPTTIEPIYIYANTADTTELNFGGYSAGIPGVTSLNGTDFGTAATDYDLLRFTAVCEISEWLRCIPTT